MKFLFDFGISQEDPLTELSVLDIRNNEHVLSIASGGEVPLSILSLRKGVKITAVDISESQLILCRLKLQAALSLPFPLNGQFLGYSKLDADTRKKIYVNKIQDSLPQDDRHFWQQNIEAIRGGVINYGRFESYIKKLRIVATLLIGKKNILELIKCANTESQEKYFDTNIATRGALKLLFQVAFHPAVYKNRGLNSRGLMHAQSNTGDRFFSKFRSFCTSTPALRNYFLQYFLLGICLTPEALPEYLQQENHFILAENKDNIQFKLSSLQRELESNPYGTFQKIHLSNIGDWMSEADYDSLKEIISDRCDQGIILCNRYLQKNQFDISTIHDARFNVQSFESEQTDRFPFYSIQSITIKPGSGK